MSFRSCGNCTFVYFLFTLFFECSLRFGPRDCVARCDPIERRTGVLRCRHRLLATCLRRFLVQREYSIPATRPCLPREKFIRPIGTARRHQLAAAKRPRCRRRLSFLCFRVNVASDCNATYFFWGFLFTLALLGRLFHFNLLESRGGQWIFCFCFHRVLGVVFNRI